MSLPITPNKAFIESLCKKNGQNTEKDAVIASSLRRDIDTSFSSKDCFIHELLQNADDQASEEKASCFFSLEKNELILRHQGKVFSQDDVIGLCSYGDVKNNQKRTDTGKSGYKDLGFKSVFRIAHRVTIWSGEWHFSFDQQHSKWKGDENYPWQIAPLWTEQKELSTIAQESIKIKNATTFIFQLRVPATVEEELSNLINCSEPLLFLKKIRKVNIKLNNRTWSIVNDTHKLIINEKVQSSWRRVDETVQIKEIMRQYLATLGPHECPERLKKAPSVCISFCYPKSSYKSQGFLFSTLPTGISTGFPFTVNAPFLLNPSRETLIENAWNIFLIETIATYNFFHVQNAISNGAYADLQYLAQAEMQGVKKDLATAFNKTMNHLFATQGILAPEFGNRLIKLNEGSFDITKLYHQFREASLLSFGPENLVHAKMEPQEINRLRGKVQWIQKEQVLLGLPQWIVKEAGNLGKNISVMRTLFSFYQKGIIDRTFLQTLMAVPLLTEEGETMKPSVALFFSDDYQPQFSYATHFEKSLLLSTKYLLKEDEPKEWMHFFSYMGVLCECTLFFENEISVPSVQKVRDPNIEEYRKYLWQVNQSNIRKKERNSPQFTEKDSLYQFVWFPSLARIATNQAYGLYFWQCLKNHQNRILENYSFLQFHAYNGVKGRHKQPLTYLQWVFHTQPLIQDKKGDFYKAQELYVTSMEKTGVKTATFPVSLSFEMQKWLGLQTDLNVEDCYRCMQAQQTAFDYAAYVLLMKNLLSHLQNPQKAKEINQKAWRFFTGNSWQLPSQLKWWSDSTNPPPDNQMHWIEMVSFSKEESEQFCAFFKIPAILEYGQVVDLTKASPCEQLRQFINEKMIDITFLWKELDSSRRVKDCYQAIVWKINTLQFLQLPNEEFSNGQTFCIGDKFYYAENWEDKKGAVARALGEYLEFSEVEIKCFEQALQKNPRRYINKAVQFNEFKEDFLHYPKEEHSLKTKENLLKTPPASPRKNVHPVPLNLEKKITPSSSPEQISQPSSVKKGVQTPTSNSRVKSPGSGKDSAKKAPPTPEEEKENKEIGNWAEKHVFYNLKHKYLNKKYTLESDKDGIAELIKEEASISIKWNNHLSNRPEERKNDNLWDSGSDHDILIKKKIDGITTERRIEVKGTKAKNIHFFLGSTEWRCLWSKDPKNYQIYVVNGVESMSPKVTIYKNLLESIREREFSYISKTEFSGGKVIEQEETEKK